MSLIVTLYRHHLGAASGRKQPFAQLNIAPVGCPLCAQEQTFSGTGCQCLLTARNGHAMMKRMRPFVSQVDTPLAVPGLAP